MAEAAVMQAKVSAKGWVVIPARLRRKYGIEPGTIVEIEDADGKIVVFPRVKDPIKDARGMLAGGPSLTQDLLVERAKDVAREEAKIRAR